MNEDVTPGSNNLSEDQLADLARLADRTLPADRRAEVEASVAGSPELSRAFERQVVAIDALRRTSEIGAPARLRAEIERRRALALKGRSAIMSARRALVATATAAILAAVLVLPGALSGSLTVADAAAFAEKPPTQRAPAGVPGTPQLLRAEVDGVRFPNYAAKFGWTPVGARRDHRSGHDATTVHYRKGGRTMAYTIISGDALDTPSDARATKRAGVEYRTLRSYGRTVVTWTRGGHTCVLSADSASRAELVALAAWRGSGAIRF